MAFIRFSRKGMDNAALAIVVSIILLLLIFGFFMLKLRDIGSLV